MRWPESAEELEREQERLAELEPESWYPATGGVTAAGCFVCFPRGGGGAGSTGDPAWAGAALLRPDGRCGTALVTGAAGSPYLAGLLALREGPLLEATVRALPEPADVLIVNATGRDHPRGAGLALHLGAVLGIPSIGVTHRPFLARGEPPEPARGSERPLTLDDRVVGSLLRTQDGRLPLAIHAGWRIDPHTAVELVLSLPGTSRTPEPIRQARQIARLARAGRL